MSHAAREAQQSRRDPLPRSLLLMLALLTVLGIASTIAAVQGARTANAASRGDVERNRVLVEQVKALQEQADVDRANHRTRNEELHADICRLIYEVIQAAPSLRDQGISPCRPAEQSGG